MRFSKAKLIYFSPTKATKHVVEEVAAGLSVESIEHVDLTYFRSNAMPRLEFTDELVIIGAPVYAGRIPNEAVTRFKEVRGNNNPAVLVVLYGNREFEDALLELKMLAEDMGFIPVVGGAFIGEHSFSTNEQPVAPGRPDEEDLKHAVRLGQGALFKMESINNLEQLPNLQVPGDYPHKKGVEPTHIIPFTDETKCLLCGDCVDVCPVNAIVLDKELITDCELCIRCSACVKQCPEEAREWRDELTRGINKRLFENFSKRKEPELFGI